MIKRIWFWLECSRIFTTPMAIMSWLVAFSFGIKNGGNILNGILALIGVTLGQLATNLFDDYIDYKTLIAGNEKNLQNCQKVKCKYITDGTANLEEVFLVVFIYCLIAGGIGLYLTYSAGLPTLIFATIGAFAVALYSKCNYFGLGEITVFTIFGPILFGGVYFIMTKSFSIETFGISIATGLMTVCLLHTHALLDFDYDIKVNKKTLSCILKDKNKALNALVAIIAGAYLTIAILVILKLSTPWLLISYLSIPYAIELYYSVKLYNEDKSAIPDKNWWNFPMENWSFIKKQGSESFSMRLYQARNLMIYFSLLICLAKIFLSRF